MRGRWLLRMFIPLLLLIMFVSTVLADSYYTIQRGDTLYGIARRFGVSLNAVTQSNNIVNPNLIYEGQTLLIPDGTDTPPGPTPLPTAVTATPPPPTPIPTKTPPSTETTYVVQAGDTLYRIASRFNVSIQMIANANGISNVNYIHVGQVLVIPGGNDPVSVPPNPTPIPIVTTVPATPPPDPVSNPNMGYIWPVDYIGLYQGFYYGHTAIDIPAVTGTAVVASADGVVSFAGWHNAGFGYLITIDHANNVRTIYAHNSQLLVQTGQAVKQGEAIALSGGTGYSTHPHVHFGMLDNGRAVNPCGYLPGGC